MVCQEWEAESTLNVLVTHSHQGFVVRMCWWPSCSPPASNYSNSTSHFWEPLSLPSKPKPSAQKLSQATALALEARPPHRMFHCLPATAKMGRKTSHSPSTRALQAQGISAAEFIKFENFCGKINNGEFISTKFELTPLLFLVKVIQSQRETRNWSKMSV